MVMEFVEGCTLKEMIEHKGPLSAKEAIAIAMQICDGLAHAHQNGIIHRDIKPDNIMCTADGRYKVTDFGISRLIKATSTFTKTGTVMGSVHYFSPEQASGREIGYSSDLYSLGVVLYEMITGQVPFDSDEYDEKKKGDSIGRKEVGWEVRSDPTRGRRGDGCCIQSKRFYT